MSFGHHLQEHVDNGRQAVGGAAGVGHHVVVRLWSSDDERGVPLVQWLRVEEGVIQFGSFKMNDFGQLVTFANQKACSFVSKGPLVEFLKNCPIAMVTFELHMKRVNGRDLVVLSVVHAAHQRLQVASFAGDDGTQKRMEGVHGVHDLKMEN